MDNLRFVLIDSKTEVKNILALFEQGFNVQISFVSLEDFNTFFPKFSDLFYEYIFQIKSLYCPVIGNVFEDTVKIISTLEDILETEIKHIVVESKFYEDIKQLCEFYYDDLQDGSLDISIYNDGDNFGEFKGPVDIIAYIERNRLQGVTLATPGHIFNYWVADSLVKYCSCIYNKETSDNYWFEYRKYKGFFVETKEARGVKDGWE